MPSLWDSLTGKLQEALTGLAVGGANLRPSAERAQAILEDAANRGAHIAESRFFRVPVMAYSGMPEKYEGVGEYTKSPSLYEQGIARLAGADTGKGIVRLHNEYFQTPEAANTILKHELVHYVNQNKGVDTGKAVAALTPEDRIQLRAMHRSPLYPGGINNDEMVAYGTTGEVITHYGQRPEEFQSYDNRQSLIQAVGEQLGGKDRDTLNRMLNPPKE